ncbi:hypothetical protein JTE90_013779 [Oedothorax gibbosus]|uniref:Uncharacterized protein n=1 Tax=Oedothorax gibbosus TaxID=931172 RepID=A0AAV6V083_9ARAC|nr:hypothetical protein JTE90_013779 [Oedothorax gibbosus]
MDSAIRFQVIVLIAVLICGHLTAETWSNNANQEKSALKISYSESLYSGRNKRSSDWSSRRIGGLSSSVEYNLDAKASENVDITTEPPRVVRKVRFQNVPQQIRHYEKNGKNIEKVGNDTITSDKQGRIVRIRKFRKKKTTEKPTVATDRPSTTVRPTTIKSIAPKMAQYNRNPNSITTSTAKPFLFKAVTPQMTQYAHITVVNKEIIDQKPNRKQKNKKPAIVSFDDDNPYKKDYDIKTHRRDKMYRNTPNKGSELSSSDDLQTSDSNIRKAADSIEKSENEEEATHKLNTKRKASKVLPNTSETKEDNSMKKPKQTTTNLRNPVRDVKRLKTYSTKTTPQVTESTTVSSAPKSVEILSDSAPNQPNAKLQDPSKQKQSDYEKEETIETTPIPLQVDMIPVTPQTERDFLPIMQNNNGFRRFPQHGFQGYPYEPINPYFGEPGGQMPNRNPQLQNGGSLSPSAFRQPFPQFYHQNEPRFPGLYAPPQLLPQYHRPGSLGTPGFHHSPQLESLRRSIIGDYASEESIESTTEYSLPKFEIPSIDFNDKGCRTVYKEVSAVPIEGMSQRRMENHAKSFVMTRECFFPEGVPTTRSLDDKEMSSVTTQSPK